MDSGTALRLQGGKRRLRRLPGTEIQLHRQVAAALLLPHPVRQDIALGVGAPVVQRNRYAIEHIQLSNANLGDSGTARLRTKTLVLQNKTYAAEEILIGSRTNEIRRAWKNAPKFPEPIRGLLTEHRNLLQAAAPLAERAEDVVYELQFAVAEASSDLGLQYTPNTDVLPVLIQFLDGIVPEPPIKIDEIEPEEIQIKRRTIRQWRQWASCRGAASAKFRREVRTAYNSTCVVCGQRFPKTDVSNSGVDAAHILPWAEYDLDVVSNGICACKLHHWAFDEGLIRITCTAGRYFVEIPDEVTGPLTGAGFAIDALAQFVGEIPVSRLPVAVSKRPSPKFLKLLGEALD